MTNSRTSSAAGTQKIDRLPPHSIEAERGVLGGILQQPESCLPEAIEKIKVGNEIFYDLRHQTLYQAMVDMWAAKIPIDLITLQANLKNSRQLENVGGFSYLVGLPDYSSCPANLEYYIEIVMEKYLLRKVIQTCAGIVGRVFDYEGRVDALLDEVERDILHISQNRAAQEMPDARALVQNAIAKIEQYHQNKGALNGIATGYHDFDRMTTGLHEGEMIVIAARPSVGKTSLAMNIAEHVAVDKNIPVGVFSLEMSADQLMLRMLCSRAKVDIRKIREGFFAQQDFPKLTGAAAKIAAAPLFIDDSSALPILHLRAKARRMWQQHGIKLFVVDYMQLLNSPTRKNENRQQEVAEISGGLKALAKELKVPIIVLSQLNRELEKRQAGSSPRLSDLRESGAIEQDADLVGLLYRDDKSEGEKTDETSANVEQIKLYIAKQRNGPTGDIDLTFIRNMTRFESTSKIKPDEPISRKPHNDE